MYIICHDRTVMLQPLFHNIFHFDKLVLVISSALMLNMVRLNLCGNCLLLLFWFFVEIDVTWLTRKGKNIRVTRTLPFIINYVHKSVSFSSLSLGDYKARHLSARLWLYKLCPHWKDYPIFHVNSWKVFPQKTKIWVQRQIILLCKAAIIIIWYTYWIIF